MFSMRFFHLNAPQIAAWAAANETPNRVRAEEWQPRPDHQRWIAFAATIDLKRARRLEQMRKDFEAAKTSSALSSASSSSAAAASVSAASSSASSAAAKPIRSATAAADQSPAAVIARAHTTDSSAAAAFVAVREVWHSALIAFAVRAAQAVDAVRRRAFETAAETLMATAAAQTTHASKLKQVTLMTQGKTQSQTQVQTQVTQTKTKSKGMLKSDSSLASSSAAVVASLSAADQSVAHALQLVLAAARQYSSHRQGTAGANGSGRGNEKNNDSNDAEDVSGAGEEASDWASAMAALEARVLAPRAVLFYAWHAQQVGTLHLGSRWVGGAAGVLILWAIIVPPPWVVSNSFGCFIYDFKYFW